MNEERACQRCDQTFRPNYPSKGRPPQAFCSAKCYRANRFGEPVSLRCRTCDGPIPRKRRTAKYCSPPCYRASTRGRPSPNRNRVTRSCSWCGEDVTRPASDFHSERTFCNHTCMGEWQSEFMVGENHPRWRGGRSAVGYGLYWRPMRRLVIERSGGLCEECARAPFEEVHHRIPIRCFDEPARANTPSNLVALCKKCHTAAHKAIKSTLLDELFYQIANGLV